MRRFCAVTVAAGLVLALVAPVAADTGPNQETTDLSRIRIPISFLGDDGRTYRGEAVFDRNNETGMTSALVYWFWRNLVICDNGTPDPEDDVESEELIDFTADGVVPTTFEMPANLSSASGSATWTARKFHSTACDGVVVEDVVETHTLSFEFTASGTASRVNTRERFDNGNGTFTTVAIREVHRPGAGPLALDVGGTVSAVNNADMANIHVNQTTR